ncbi:transferrin [Odontomachus brunneus]|uniref:transferrin n=1 Tax=Odontomachus brunneus TaxID=486640 RepID=UPI0013F25514|nr:transferrin [Odontomachus brunneus]XP_032675198.1 transferrin [Odontomachus brunneus]XP_032675199.1 transferrin [Odontomachus brunneus]
MAAEPKSIMDFRTFVWQVFTAVALINCYGLANAEKLRLCVVESAHITIRIRSLCSKLAALNSPIACVLDIDRFSCLRRLIAGEADFAILEPEDLVAAAAYREYNVLVTNELRLFLNDKQSFQMVALVHKNVGHIWDVKGKRFCHPGFDSKELGWTKAFSMYFENWIIPKECDPDKTLLENRVHALSNYFEMACVAGLWSSDTIFDGQLKSRYRNLCTACDNPISCYNDDKYRGREGALLCLTDDVGDVAWVRLDDTLLHFKEEEVDKRNYNYLCPDGGTRPVEYDKPCVWISRPWPVIVASSQIAEKVARTMNLLKNTTFGWETNVLQLMESYHISPVSTENLETPEDYLGRFPGFMSANNRASCRPSRRVQWCVASNLEDRKCRWLREASIVYGVEPPISCIQETSRASCLDALRSRRADIFVARPEELLQARKKGLKPLVYALSNKKQELNRIAAVVKHDSKFRTLRDLEGAKACFTGYKSVGWNAFTSTMKNASAGKWGCPDTQAVANFFKDSCVFGLSDQDKSKLPANLYSLCKREEAAGDDISAFDCLTSGLADVAFVNLKAIEKKTGNLDQNDATGSKGYRLLCLDEPDIEKTNPCLLTWTSLGAVIAHENVTSLRHEEIYSMLLEMDNLFGITLNGLTPAFSLYGTYDNVSSVIFPEETRNLQLHGYQIQSVRSYDQIIEDLLRQEACNGVSVRISHFSGILSLCMAIVTLSRFLNC